MICNILRMFLNLLSLEKINRISKKLVSIRIICTFYPGRNQPFHESAKAGYAIWIKANLKKKEDLSASNLPFSFLRFCRNDLVVRFCSHKVDEDIEQAEHSEAADRRPHKQHVV